MAVAAGAPAAPGAGQWAAPLCARSVQRSRLKCPGAGTPCPAAAAVVVTGLAAGARRATLGCAVPSGHRAEAVRLVTWRSRWHAPSARPADVLPHPRPSRLRDGSSGARGRPHFHVGAVSPCHTCVPSTGRPRGLRRAEDCPSADRVRGDESQPAASALVKAHSSVPPTALMELSPPTVQAQLRPRGQPLPSPPRPWRPPVCCSRGSLSGHWARGGHGMQPSRLAPQRAGSGPPSCSAQGQSVERRPRWPSARVGVGAVHIPPSQRVPPRTSACGLSPDRGSVCPSSVRGSPRQWPTRGAPSLLSRASACRGAPAVLGAWTASPVIGDGQHLPSCLAHLWVVFGEIPTRVICSFN